MPFIFRVPVCVFLKLMNFNRRLVVTDLTKHWLVCLASNVAPVAMKLEQILKFGLPQRPIVRLGERFDLNQFGEFGCRHSPQVWLLYLGFVAAEGSERSCVDLESLGVVVPWD